MGEMSRSADLEPLALDAPFDIVSEVMRFEPPDIVVARWGRTLTRDEEMRVVAFLRDAGTQLGGLFTLSNLSASHASTSMSRSLELNRQIPVHAIRATAIIGASFQMRVFTEALVRAARLLRLEMANTPYRFVPDEDTARAWFDELRRASRPPAGSPRP